MFKEIPANKLSILQRKPVYGVGINDADYMTLVTVDCKQYRCPYYKRWLDMLTRCYDDKFQKRFPTYIGCTICKEWVKFSNFRSWMENQDWPGKSLDKDIISQGNKIYSPSTCIFVTEEINNLLTNKKLSRGDYPLGVSLKKRNGKYVAQCRAYGKTKHLGYFDTANEARKAYIKFKVRLIIKIADEQCDQLKEALYRRAELLNNEL